MTPLDRINAYTAHRMGIMTKEERDVRLRSGGSMTWEDRCNAEPLGTKAPAIGGGYWIKTQRGWKWGKHGCTFQTPGGDWTGELIPPKSNKQKDEQS